MAIKKRIKNLSNLTRELLGEGESVRSDFKRLPEGISTEDFVSFANSEIGGQLLIGVDEQVVGKIQVGLVCGCDVSDATVLQVLNKAVSCIPPISINIYIENLDDKPILRVEIPPSQTKPHCTPKGIYCRRDGARNRPLHPSELLRLFLDSEASVFAARFEVAAERIMGELNGLESSLESSIKSMSDQLGWADYKLGDTESTLDRIQGQVAKLTIDADHANSRLRTLFRQDKREDPVQKKARLQYVNAIISKIREDKNTLARVIAGDELELKSHQAEDSDITNEDVKQLLQIAVKYVRDTERDKKYQIVVKASKACSDDELKQFAAKVAAGGEVANGLLDCTKRTTQLGFIYYGGIVVGTAALKKTSAGYRAGIFKKAGSQLDSAVFHYEISWIFLDISHREKGQMNRLMDNLLPAAKDSALFATVRTSSDIMREILRGLKFLQDGTEYQSKHNPHDTVSLFVRNVTQSHTSK